MSRLEQIEARAAKATQSPLPNERMTQADWELCRHAASDLQYLLAALKDAMGALEDLAEHGVRHDLNPTGIFHPCGHFEVWEHGGGWHAYLRSADDYVRQHASTCLARLKGGEG